VPNRVSMLELTSILFFIRNLVHSSQRPNCRQAPRPPHRTATEFPARARLLVQVPGATTLIRCSDKATAGALGNKRCCSVEGKPAGMLAPEVQATTIEVSVARARVGVNGRREFNACSGEKYFGAGGAAILHGVLRLRSAFASLRSG